MFVLKSTYRRLELASYAMVEQLNSNRELMLDAARTIDKLIKRNEVLKAEFGEYKKSHP